MSAYLEQETNNTPAERPPFDYFKYRLDLLNSGQTLNLAQIAEQSRSFNPTISNKEEAIQYYNEAAKKNPNLKPEMFDQIYSGFEKEAAFIASDNAMSYRDRFYAGYRNPVLNPYGVLARTTKQEAVGSMDNFGGTIKTMSPEEQIAKNMVYKDKEGNVKHIGEYKPGKTTLIWGDLQNPDMYIEKDNNEALDIYEIRNNYGPSSMTTNPWVSLGKGFSETLIGGTAKGFTNTLEAITDAFNPGEEGWTDRLANRTNNWSRRTWGINEDEKKGMFSGNLSGFMYGFGNVTGSMAQVAAFSYAGGFMGAGLGLQSATRLSTIFGSSASGMLMSGLAYEEAKRMGIEQGPALTALVLAIGTVGAFIESRGPNSIMDMMQAGKIEAREMRENLGKKLVEDLYGKFGHKKVITAADQQEITKATYEKVLDVLKAPGKKIGGALETMQKSEKAIVSKTGNVLSTAIEEGTEEYFQNVTSETMKQLYNIYQKAHIDSQNEAIAQKQSEIDKQISQYETSSEMLALGAREIEVKKHYRKSNDGSRVQISEEQYNQEIASLNAERAKLAASVKEVEEGKGLFQTPESIIMGGLEDMAAGTVGAVPFGLLKGRMRKKQIIDYAREGKLGKLEEQLAVMEKIGVDIPKNVSAKTGKVFNDNDNLYNPETNPSVSDVFFGQLRNEIAFVKEMFNGATFKKDAMPEIQKGIDEFNQGISESLSDRWDLQEKKEAIDKQLEETKDEAAEKTLKKDLEDVKVALEAANQKYDYYTNKSFEGNKTPYTKAFTEFVKNSVINSKFDNALSAKEYGQHLFEVNEFIAQKKEFEKQRTEHIAGQIADIQKDYESLMAATPATDVDQIKQIRDFVKTVSEKKFKFSQAQLTGLESKLSSLKEKYKDSAEKATADLDTSFAEFDGTVFDVLKSIDLTSPEDAIEQVTPEQKAINEVDFFGRFNEELSQMVDDYLEYNEEAKAYRVKEGKEEEFGSDANRIKVESILKSLEKDDASLRTKVVYNDIKKGNITPELTKALSDVKGEISKVKNDSDIANNPVYGQESNDYKTNAINVKLQQGKADILLKGITQVNKSYSKKELEFNFSKLMADMNVLSAISEMLNKEDTKKINDILEAQAFKDSIELLASDADEKSKHKALSQIRAYIAAAHSVIHREGLLLKKSPSGKPVYESVLSSFKERLYGNVSDASYRNGYDFKSLEYADYIRANFLDAKSDVSRDKSSAQFTMLYLVSHLNKIAYLDEVKFDSILKPIIDDKGIVPNYDQYDKIGSIVARWNNNSNDILYAAQQVFNPSEAVTERLKEQISNQFSVFLQGPAGAGKTLIVVPYSIEAYSKYSNQPLNIHAFVPFESQKNAIGKSIESVKGQNIQIVGLYEQAEQFAKNAKDGDVFIFDEATLFETKQITAIQKLFEGSKARVLYLGDPNQSYNPNNFTAALDVSLLSYRITPLFQVFRSGVIDIQDFQNSFIRARRSINNANSNQTVQLQPNSYYISEDFNHKGLQYTSSEKEVIDSFFEEVNGRLAKGEQLTDKSIMLVVNDQKKKDEIISNYTGDAENIGSFIYTAEVGKKMAQSNEANNVYSIVSQKPEQDNMSFYSAMLVSGSRARQYAKIYLADNALFSKVTNTRKSSASDILESFSQDNINALSEINKAGFDAKIEFGKNINIAPAKAQKVTSAPVQPVSAPVAQPNNATGTSNTNLVSRDSVISQMEEGKQYKLSVKDNKSTNERLVTAKLNDKGKLVILNDKGQWVSYRGSFVSNPIEIVKNDKISQRADLDVKSGKEYSYHGRLITIDEFDERMRQGVFDLNGETYVTFEGNTMKYQDFISSARNITDAPDEDVDNSTEKERKSLGGDLLQNNRIAFSNRTLFFSKDVDKDQIEAYRKVKAAIINYVFNSANRTKLQKAISFELNSGTKYYHDVEGVLKNQKTLVVKLNKDRAGVIYNAVLQVAKKAASDAGVSLEGFNWDHLGNLYLPEQYINGKFTPVENVTADNIVEKAEQIKASFNDATDVKNESNKAYQILKLIASVPEYLDSTFNQSGYVSLGIERAGRVIKGTSPQALSDFISKNDSFYRLSRIEQHSNKGGKPQTVAYFKSKTDPAGPEVKVYIRAKHISESYINDLLTELDTLKDVAGKEYDVDSEAWRRGMLDIEQHPAYKFLMYNRGVLQNQLVLGLPLEIDARGNVKLSGRTPIERAKALRETLEEMKGSMKFYKDFRVNPKDETSGTRTTTRTLSDEVDNYETNADIIQDPVLFVGADPNKLFKDNIYEKLLGGKPAKPSSLSFGGLSFTSVSDGTKYGDGVSIDEAKSIIDNLLGAALKTQLSFVEGLEKDGVLLNGLVTRTQFLLNNQNGKVSRRIIAHEVQHYVNNFLLTEAQRNSLYDSVRDFLGKDISNNEAEEFLSETIETYDAVSGNFKFDLDRFGERSTLRRFFDWLKNLFGYVNKNQVEIEGHLRSVLNGAFRNSKVINEQAENIEFASRKKDYSNIKESNKLLGGAFARAQIVRVVAQQIKAYSFLNNNISEISKTNKLTEFIGFFRDERIKFANEVGENTVKLADGSLKKISEVETSDLINNPDLTDMVISYRLGKQHKGKLGVDYILNEIFPNLDLKNMEFGYEGDSTLGKSTLAKDGMGGASDFLIFAIKNTKINLPYPSHYNGDYIPASFFLKELQSIARKHSLVGTKLKPGNRIEALRQAIKEKISNRNTAKENDATLAALEAFYNEFLAEADFSKGLASHWSYANQVDDITEYAISQGIDISNISNKSRESLQLLTDLSNFVFSLEKRSYYTAMVKQIKDKIVYKMNRFRSSNLAETMEDIKRDVRTKNFVSLGSTIGLRDQTLERFTGLYIKDGKLTESKRNRTIKVDYNDKAKKGAIVFKGTEILTFSTSGKIIFDIPEGFVRTAKTEDKYMLIKSLFYTLGFSKVDGFTFDTMMRSSSGDATLTDLVNLIGFSAISLHNTAISKAKSLKSFPSEANQMVPLLNEAFSGAANISEIDSDEANVVKYEGNQQFVKPYDMFDLLEKVARLKSEIYGNDYANFTYSAEGKKVYLFTNGSYVSALMPNNDDNSASSNQLKEYVKNVPDTSFATARLKQNVYLNDGVVDKVHTVNGLVGQVQSGDVNRMSPKDFIDTEVFSFLESVKKQFKGNRVFMPSQYLGDKSYLVKADGSFGFPVFLQVPGQSISKKDQANTYIVNNRDFLVQIERMFLEYQKEALSTFNKLSSFMGIKTPTKNLDEAYIQFNELVAKKMNKLSEAGKADFIRKIETSDLVKGRDYNIQNGVIMPGNAFNLFVVASGQADTLFNNQKFSEYNSVKSASKDYMNKTKLEGKEYNASILDWLLSDRYNDFAKHLKSSGHIVPKELESGFGGESLYAAQLIKLNPEMEEYISKRKQLYASLEGEQDNIASESIRAQAKGLKRPAEIKTLHPYYKGLLLTHLVHNKNFNDITTGPRYAYKGVNDFAKRSGAPLSNGNVIVNDMPHGITNTFREIIIDDIPGAIQMLKGIGVKNIATDGGDILNPQTARNMRNTNREQLGSGDFKTIHFNNDFENDITRLNKKADMNTTESMINFMNPTVVDFLNKLWLGGFIVTPDGKLIENSNPDNAYNYYKTVESLGFNAAHDKVNEMMNFGGKQHWKTMLIDKISPVSTQKLMYGKKSVIDWANPATSQIFINEVSTDNLRVQLNPENDVTETEQRNPSQIISFVGVADENAANIVYNRMAEIARKTVAEIQGKDIPSWLKKTVAGMTKNSFGAYAELISDPEISIHLPNLFKTTFENLISLQNEGIRPKLAGSRLTQHTDAFIQVYEYNGQVGDAEMVRRMGGNVSTLTPRPLRHMTYKTASGQEINDAEQLIGKYDSKETVVVEPGEVLLSYSYVSQFGIEGKTLTEAFSVETTTGPVYVRGGNILSLLNGKEIIDERFAGKTAEEIQKYFDAFENTLQIYANRVPANNFGSGFIGKVVGFINDNGNTIITSSKRTVFDGSDFDIDQLTVFFKKLGDDLSINEVSDENLIFSSIFDIYKNPDIETLDMILEATAMDKLKQVAKQYVQKQGNNFNDVTTNARYHQIINDGNAMIGMMANLNKLFGNLAYVTKTNFELKRQLENLFPGMAINESGLRFRNKENKHILQVIGEYMQASLDNAKELLLGYLNVNKATFRPLSSMILSGMTIEEIDSYLNNPYIKQIFELHNRLQSFNSYPGDILKEIDKRIEIFSVPKTERQIAREISKLSFDADTLRRKISKLKSFAVNVNLEKESMDFNAELEQKSADTNEEISILSEDLSSIEGTIEILESNLEIAQQNPGSLTANQQKYVDDLKFIRQHFVKGEVIARLGTFTGLNQGMKSESFDFYGVVKTIENSIGKPIEQFGSSMPAQQKLFKDRKPEDFDYLMAKENEIRGLLNIEKVVLALPHVTQYVKNIVEVKNAISQIGSNHPWMNKLKKQLQKELMYGDVMNKHQFTLMEKMYNHLLIGSFYDLHYSGETNLPNSFAGGSKMHELKTHAGRKDFIHDFADHFEELLTVYNQIKNKNNQNEFLNSLDVNQRSAASNGKVILLRNSNGLEEEDIDYLIKEFKQLNKFVVANANHFGEKSSVDWEALFQHYNVINYGLTFSKGNMADIVLRDPLGTGRTVLKEMSAYVNNHLMSTMSRLNEGYVEGHYGEGILRISENLLDHYVAYEQEMARSPFEYMEKANKMFKQGIEKRTDNSEKTFMNPFTGEMLTEDQFVEEFMPKYIQEWDDAEQRKVLKKRIRYAPNSEMSSIEYRPVYDRFVKNSYPWSDVEASSDYIRSIKNLPSETIKALNETGSDYVLLKADSFFPEGVTKRDFYVPGVGYVEAKERGDMLYLDKLGNIQNELDYNDRRDRKLTEAFMSKARDKYKSYELTNFVSDVRARLSRNERTKDKVIPSTVDLFKFVENMIQSGENINQDNIENFIVNFLTKCK